MTGQLRTRWDCLGAKAQSNALVLKVARFGTVGVLSGMIFASVTSLLTSWVGFDPRFSSGIGYVASIPVNFLGNRNFSFRSENRWLGDLKRYATLHIANIVLTSSAMGAAVNTFHLHYAVGIVTAVILVPIVNFAAMNWWVFRSNAPRPSAGHPTDTKY